MIDKHHDILFPPTRQLTGLSWTVRWSGSLVRLGPGVGLVVSGVILVV